MEKKILVAVDLSEISAKVIEIADQWGMKIGAELYIAHVFADAMEDQEPIHKLVDSLKIQSKHRIVHRWGNPRTEILKMETEFEADLIVMGGHSYSLTERMLLGGNSESEPDVHAARVALDRSVEKLLDS